VFAPSGEQFEIEAGDQRAVVVEVGGGLRTYSARDREVLDGYGLDEICGSGRAQVLVPWPNRVAEGKYEFRGEEQQLPVNEPSTGSAIHGLVRWGSWEAVERDRDRVVVRHRLHPQPGYPFALELWSKYSLSGTGLRVVTQATNLGDRPCPFGAGFHPYLLPGTPSVDDALLRLPARSVLETDEGGVPVGRSPVEGTELDFRGGRALGGTKLDHCFGDLERDADGLVRVTLGWPGSGVTLWADAAYRYLQLYTGDDRPDVSRRSLAVEPMTCPPQAFRSGEDVVVLEPGASWSGVWGLSPS
jgi:aldose 1-epimerase